jgi:tetratricopeptide (TPR) repeat protein
MENLFFLRIEIIIFLISISYFIYYTVYKIKNISLKKQRNCSKNINTENKYQKNKIVIKETKFQKEETKEMDSERKIKISEILRKEAVYYERGDYESAKLLIVEWLALDKNNKQLNIGLANIYNKELDYKKSEYIYRELIEKQKDDFDLLKKLGFVLALQKKYKDSIRVYKEALRQRQSEPWINDILSDLTFEVEDFEWCIKFSKIILKDKPRDSEKLQLIAYSYDYLWDLEKALIYYWKIIELQPYNTKIIDRVSEIEDKLNKYTNIEEVEQIKNTNKK